MYRMFRRMEDGPTRRHQGVVDRPLQYVFNFFAPKSGFKPLHPVVDGTVIFREGHISLGRRQGCHTVQLFPESGHFTNRVQGKNRPLQIGQNAKLDQYGKLTPRQRFVPITNDPILLPDVHTDGDRHLISPHMRIIFSFRQRLVRPGTDPCYKQRISDVLPRLF